MERDSASARPACSSQLPQLTAIIHHCISHSALCNATFKNGLVLLPQFVAGYFRRLKSSIAYRYIGIIFSN